MANIGRETVLKRNEEVIAGVRVINLSWSSDGVDISEGEDDGYRLYSEIDGIVTLQIDVELITKDYELQEIAYSRSNSRLLENVSLELANINSFTYELTTDFYLTNLSESASYNDALSFSASLVSSARIENGQIIGVSKDQLTGQILGYPGYSYKTISTALYEDQQPYWNNNQNGAVWDSINNEWVLSGASPYLRENRIWNRNFRPDRVSVEVRASVAGSYLFESYDSANNQLASGIMNLGTTKKVFTFDLNFVDGINPTLNDLRNLVFNMNGETAYVSAIAFDNYKRLVSVDSGNYGAATFNNENWTWNFPSLGLPSAYTIMYPSYQWSKPSLRPNNLIVTFRIPDGEPIPSNIQFIQRARFGAITTTVGSDIVNVNSYDVIEHTIPLNWAGVGDDYRLFDFEIDIGIPAFILINYEFDSLRFRRPPYIP